jgi:hypothetical protein
MRSRRLVPFNSTRDIALSDSADDGTESSDGRAESADGLSRSSDGRAESADRLSRSSDGRAESAVGQSGSADGQVEVRPACLKVRMAGSVRILVCEVSEKLLEAGPSRSAVGQGPSARSPAAHSPRRTRAAPRSGRSQLNRRCLHCDPWASLVSARPATGAPLRR